VKGEEKKGENTERRHILIPRRQRANPCIHIARPGKRRKKEEKKKQKIGARKPVGYQKHQSATLMIIPFLPVRSGPV
jgi:hypothetical protein